MKIKVICMVGLLELPLFSIAFPFRGDVNLFMGTLGLWQFFIIGLLMFVREVSEERFTELRQI